MVGLEATKMTFQTIVELEVDSTAFSGFETLRNSGLDEDTSDTHRV